MLGQLSAVIKFLNKTLVSVQSTTLESAIEFSGTFSTSGSMLLKSDAHQILQVFQVIHRFSKCFETGTDDRPFRDLYTRDLTFRKTWLDLLTSLLTYMESLNAWESGKTQEFVAFVSQTRTTIENARKQLSRDRKKTIKPWFVASLVRHKTRRKKALAALDHLHTDADTLYNMRDILNEM
jgi:hypothetical protein